MRQGAQLRQAGLRAEVPRLHQRRAALLQHLFGCLPVAHLPLGAGCCRLFLCLEKRLHPLLRLRSLLRPALAHSLLTAIEAGWRVHRGHFCHFRV